MANRPKGFGMTAELQAIKNSKWDPYLATEVLEWIDKELNGQCRINPIANDQNSVHSLLKDGVILVKLTNALNLSKAKINESKMAFKMMENIGNFLSAVDAAGVPKSDTFQTVDLYEKQNMPQVISGILALKRKVCGVEASENKREFTAEQLKDGQNIIGLQMGSNIGASQSGQCFGKSRAIFD